MGVNGPIAENAFLYWIFEKRFLCAHTHHLWCVFAKVTKNYSKTFKRGTSTTSEEMEFGRVSYFT